MSIKALDKLREWSHKYDNGWIQEDGSIVFTTNTHGVCYGENYGDAIRKMIDAVEREVDEKYMPLPLDADGVPIHVGDVLDCDANGYEGTFSVFAVGHDVVVGNHPEFFWYKRPMDTFHVAKYCCHVKPRTVEDVIRDIIMRCIGHSPEYWDVPIAEYADELRELMGGGAE